MRIILGLVLFPVWVIAMILVYPFCWLGARSWELMTGDSIPINKVTNWGWAHR